MARDQVEWPEPANQGLFFYFGIALCQERGVGGGRGRALRPLLRTSLPLMVALGFTLFLRLPCREHSIFREVSEALDAGTLHADMQDPWFSQGF